MDISVLVKTAFGSAVREYRKAAKLSLQELADAAEIAPKFLWQIEKGHTGSTVETLFKIAKALSVEPAELVIKTAASMEIGASPEATLAPLTAAFD